MVDAIISVRDTQKGRVYALDFDLPIYDADGVIRLHTK